MGERLLREFLEQPGRWKVRNEVVREGQRPLQSKASVLSLTKSLFDEVDVLGTHFNLLVLETIEVPEADLSVEPQGLEIVCPLGDPGNLGALLRSSLAFGASQMILTEEAASPFHPKAIKASAGATLRSQIKKTGPIASYRAAGKSYALDMDGASLDRFDWPRDVRLIVGEEGAGLPTLAGVPRLSIPTGPIESLNATVAASLAIDSWRRSRLK